MLYSRCNKPTTAIYMRAHAANVFVNLSRVTHKEALLEEVSHYREVIYTLMPHLNYLMNFFKHMILFTLIVTLLLPQLYSFDF